MKIFNRIATLSVAVFFLSAPWALQGESEQTVSRAEHEMIRTELEELRSELEKLKNERSTPSDEPVLEQVERFAPEDSVSPIAEWARSLTFTAPDDRFSMTIRGRIQPRYDYERREDAPNRSSFSLRRLRPDIQGHAYTRALTYRIMPEFARTASLRDGWVNYRHNESLEVRFGQYNVPFAWERDVSSDRQLFVERSTANNEFEWADGRDIGVMIHGKPVERVRYGVGIFGGEGRNVERTSSEGHLFVGRVTYTATGDYPNAEALLQPVDETSLSFGLGAGYANKNAARDWHTWTADAQTAHVFGATADAHLQADRFSGHLIGFFRDVNTRENAPSYDGFGFTLQGGYLLIPDRLFGNLRYSYSEPNRDEREGKTREVIAGVQVYQFGHGAKIHFEIGRGQQHDGNRWLDTDIFRTQYQLLF